MSNMSESEMGALEPIPVFGITPRGGVQRAAHPDYKGSISSESREETLNRVGSAVRRKDGSYLIQLTAFPVNGQLLLKPRTEDEYHTSN
jgi:hypothetical protein